MRVAAWLEVLGVAKVPAHLYDTLYRRALNSREITRRNGGEVLALRADDLVDEYRMMQQEEQERHRRAKAAGYPAEQCPERDDHKSPDEALRDYGLPGHDAEWLPCHVCRPAAFQQRRIESAERRKAVQAMIELASQGREME